MSSRAVAVLLVLSSFLGACGSPAENPPAAPDIRYFLADPAEVEAGEPVVLSWSVGGASAVRIEDGSGWSAEQPGEGTLALRPSNDVTYTLTATGPGGTHTATTFVDVRPGAAVPVIASFVASPERAGAGVPITLAWFTKGAESVTIRDSRGGRVDPGVASAANGTVDVNPFRDETYTLEATSKAGSVRASVSVDRVPPPRLSLRADHHELDAGASTVLRWSVTDAASVTLDGTPVETTGERVVTPERSASYVLEASGVGGDASAQAYVAVRPVIDRFELTTAGPFRAGEAVGLRWSTRGASELAISQSDHVFHRTGAAEGELSAAVGPDGSFVLTARSGWLETTQRLIVPLTTLPRIRSFAIDRGEVSARPDLPAEITLSWHVDGAARLELVAAPGGLVDLGNRSMRIGSIVVPVTQSTTYTLTARNEDGSAGSVQSVLVHPASRVARFDARPMRVGPGETVELTWSSEGAAALRLEKDGVDLGVGELAGSLEDVVVTEATYVLRTYNDVGFEVASQPLAITVGAPLIGSFASDAAAELTAGQPLSFTWQNLGGTRLRIVDELDGTVFCETTSLEEIPAGGCTIAAPPADALHPFTLRVENGAGEDARTVEVRIVAGPVIDRLVAGRERITVGEPVELAWTVSNDAYGRRPTLTLTDDMGNTYDVSAADPNQAAVSIVPTAAGIRSFVLRAETPDTTAATANVPLATYAVPVIDSLAFDPAVVDTQGGTVPASTTLRWTTQHGAVLRAYRLATDGSWILPPEHETSDVAEVGAGSAVLAPPPGASTYEVELINPAGRAVHAAVGVDVDPVEIDSFVADPADIILGDTSTLRWATRRAARLELDPRVAEATPVSNGFRDLRQSAAAQTLPLGIAGQSGYDRGDITFPSTFRFPWYGIDRQAVRVSQAGWLSFDLLTTSGTGYSERFPTSNFRYVHLAPFWDSIRGGTVQYEFGADAAGEFLVVQWSGCYFDWAAHNPAQLDFQVVLREDGSFEYHYGTMTSAHADRHDGRNASIGYQNDGGSWGAALSFGEAVPNGLSNRGWSFRFDLPTSGSWAVKPYGDSAYTLTASNLHSRVTATATVRVWKPVRLVSASVSAEPVIGTPFTVSWTTDHATNVQVIDAGGTVRCTYDPPVLTTGRSGSCQLVETTPGDYAYTVRAIGGFAGNGQSTTLPARVYTPLSLDSFTSSATAPILAGEPVTLTWATTGAAAFSIAANGVSLDLSGMSPASGSLVHRPATTTTYELSITESGRTRTARVTATVRTAGVSGFGHPSGQAPAGSNNVTMSWTTFGATSVWWSGAPAATAEPINEPFIDLTGTGAATVPGITGAISGTVIQFPDGFAFPFTGTVRSSAKVFASGYVSFESTAAGLTGNAALPTSSAARPHLIPFWDGLNPASGGSILYAVQSDARGRYLVIQWKNLVFSTSTLNPAVLEFEVVLRDDGTFEYRYGRMSSSATQPGYGDGQGATIGYQDLLGKATQITFNAAVQDGLGGRSWRFDPNVDPNGSGSTTLTDHGTTRLCVFNAGYMECRDSAEVKIVKVSDVVITEIMPTPAAPHADPASEWFEIRNTADFAIDVSGWEIRSAGDAGAFLDGSAPIVLQRGEVMTLSRGGSADAGFVPRYAGYGSGVTLDGSGDSLALVYGQLIVDSVTWSSPGWTVSPGTSLTLDPSWQLRDHTRNDLPTSWCQSSETYDTGNDGSPAFVGRGCRYPRYDVDSLSFAPFIDISASPTATPLPNVAAGNSFMQVPGGIGFDFPFFESTVTDLHVSSQGWLSFSPILSANSNNSSLPSGVAPKNSIFGFWDWLAKRPAPQVTSAETELLTVGGRQVRIVQWTNFQVGFTAGQITFQIQLWSNGDVVTVMRDAAPTSTTDANALRYYRGSQATIGMQDANATSGLIHSYNSDHPSVTLYPGRSVVYRRK